jgi:hypothetical protein
MAEVTSLTAQAILDLTSQWSGIPEEQQDLRGLIALLNAYVESNEAQITEFADILPQFLAALASNQNAISDLNDVVLVNLQTALDNNAAALQNLNEVTLPALQLELDNNVENVETRPNIYVQPEAPEDPDENDRDLVVGDTWQDSDDGYKQYTWNGVEWTTLSVDIPDIAATIEQYLSPQHTVLDSSPEPTTLVTTGANINP